MHDVTLLQHTLVYLQHGESSSSNCCMEQDVIVISWVYGHFGPKTLRTQDISELVPKCPMDTSAPP